MNLDPKNGGHLRIEVALIDGERLAFSNAIEELRQCFAAAGCYDFRPEVSFHSALSEIEMGTGPAVIVTSMLLELTQPEKPLDVVDAHLRTAFSVLLRRGCSAIFLSTVFRGIDPKAKAKDPVAAAARIERIRRLNFLAAELSHDFDINIIDLDRSFAHIGGRSLGTDFNLHGPAAVSAATHVIVSTLFAAGFDDICSPEVQDSVKAIYYQRRNAYPGSRKLSHSYASVPAGRHLQTFAPGDGSRRRLPDLWRNLMEGRMTTWEAFLTVLHAARRRLQRRLYRRAV
jgi:hypothetical protein